MSAIELIGVSKHYGDVVAVDSTHLSVHEGELVTLLGPSGSGKSTLLSVIAGLTPLSTGAIRIGGRDVTHVPPAKRNLGMVFQSYALFPHMTVFDNVAFPLQIRGVSRTETKTRVRRTLERVRLDGFEDRRQNELSGGQQQRVALARALVFEPDILLLDEPMGALDKNLRTEVQLELRQLQRELGVTTIMVTHDQEEALSLSQRIVVLNQGRVQQVDTPAAIYEQPCNQFVAEFIGTANLLEGVLEARDGTSVQLKTGQMVACRPGHGLAGAVKVLLRPEHLRLQPDAQAQGLRATVVESVYFGQSSRIHLRTDDGTALIAIVDEKASRYGEGQVVVVSWEPGDAWVVEA